ncbi:MULTISPECIES: DUF397 domain-containing protein [unclassified Streptomyces]|uniref:DUF397 domain-containing protein n=1 Tax=unclassified Streptomyces TaxID=2593676 RepID=UPI000F78474E|nr:MULTISPECIES: DUF397 domain-containing protein [unclassified Streptomyces]
MVRHPLPPRVRPGRRPPRRVPVRDSKESHGPALVFTADRGSAFIAAVKDGDLRARVPGDGQSGGAAAVRARARPHRACGPRP